ncbi:glycoside hydrolase family 27 protein [Williamsia sp. CHRR-6]|nr:glycoside hydrolase family 27 protein [Williamsia sp. CHRR-6]
MVAIPGVAATPPMGWNSWNTFGCTIDESLIRSQADALVTSGLASAGYRYVVVDDCWAAPQRDRDGRLVASPQRFPSGMRALGDYLHRRGLLFGLYSTPSNKTCAQRYGTYPGASGSAGHEKTDAATFASWGVDYLKYDWCSDDTDVRAQRTAFITMRDAIRAAGRPLVYSINPNSGGPGQDQNSSLPGAAYDWGGVASMTRLTNDIAPVWRVGGGRTRSQGIAEVIAASRTVNARVGPGRWLDLDMLEVGVGTALTAAQQRTHLAMWAMMAAPLITGHDLTSMTTQTRDLLANRGILAIDQDRLGRPATAVRGDGSIRRRSLADGSVVVSLTNAGTTSAGMSFTLDEVDAPGSVAAIDAFSGARLPIDRRRGVVIVPVPAYDTLVIRLATS